MSEAAKAGRAKVLTFHEICTTSTARTARVTGATLKDVKAKTTHDVDVDIILPMLGFVSDIGPLAEWGLTIEKDEIVVTSTMETGRAGIYAAGDITTYPGKLKLIATGLRRGRDGGEPGGALDLPGEEGEPGTFVEHGDIRAEG